MENGAEMGECFQSFQAASESDSLGILGEGLGELNETLKIDEGGRKCGGLNTEAEAGRGQYFEGMKVQQPPCITFAKLV